MKSSVAFISCLFLFFLFSCKTDITTDLTKEYLIPKPLSVTPDFNAFIFNSNSTIELGEPKGELRPASYWLAEQLKKITGFEPTIKSIATLSFNTRIVITLDGVDSLNHPESYKLDIGQKEIHISANQPEGIFRGVQTLMQLIPAQSVSDSVKVGKWIIPTGVIIDQPRFEYRGMMLDVARHFFDVDEVKQVIDLMAYYKLNFLHMHLSDDQGWRIEIKSWPNLAIHGGKTQVGGGNGGYYTQDQYTELVTYAADRCITIVPEIDMPGHTNAALASYSELNSDKKATELYTGTKVGFSSLNTRDELTYIFIEDVIRELAAITPGPYIHIGGDESHSTQHDDYIYFMNRVVDIVAKFNKKIIGWDELAHADISSNAVIQYWAKAANAKMGIEKGAKVLFSPATLCYLDMKYTPETKLGLNWSGYIEVDKAYSWNPETLIPGIDTGMILGIEAPLWSETVTNFDEISFMTIPRLPGFAELGWSSPETINWEEYRVRLAKQKATFKRLNLNFYQSPTVDW